MNPGLLSIFSIGAISMIISIPLVAYAVSQYDKDGFTIFPTKSGDYMVGYRDGVVQAQKDVDNFDKIGGIDARQDKIKCPPNFNTQMCQGYKDGYADRAMDELE